MKSLLHHRLSCFTRRRSFTRILFSLVLVLFVSGCGCTETIDNIINPDKTITVSASTLTINEGSTSSYTIVLGAAPSADVVIAISGSSSTEFSVSPASLTFTTSNWNTGQTVTVSATTDNTDDGNATGAVSMTVSSSDPEYAAKLLNSISVTITDINSIGVIEPITSLSVNEGAAGTFTMVLGSQPSGNVVVDLSSSNTNEATVSPASVTFTTSNWSTAQSIIVSAVNDQVDDGDQAVTITVSLNSGSTADTTGYASINPDDITVTTVDQHTASVALSPTTLSVTEGGSTSSFTVVLGSKPTLNVSIDLVSGDTSQATIDQAQLTFTTANWSTPQTATVTAVNDDVDESNSSISIATTTNTADSTYAAINPTDVSVTVVDNDTAGVTVTQSGGSTSVSETGTTDTFTVVLTSKPTGNVVMTVQSGDTGELTVSPATLTFTAVGTNWSTAQTVTVTGVADSLDDGDQSVTITVAMDTGATQDANYDAINPDDVSATVTDIDTLEINIYNSAGDAIISNVSFNESATGTVKVALGTQPSGDVVIDVAVSDSSKATVTTPLTFSNANWSTKQTVTVTPAVILANLQINGGVTFDVNDAASNDSTGYEALAQKTIDLAITNDVIWNFDAYLKPSSTNLDNNLGYSAAINGNYAIVGVPRYDTTSDEGAAIVYFNNLGTWGQQALIRAPANNRDTDDRFGWSVDISGSTAVIGAMWERSNAPNIPTGGILHTEADVDDTGVGSLNDAGLQIGAVYVYTRSDTSWSFQAYLKPTEIDNNDYFGESVAIDTDTIAVGAPGEDDSGVAIVNGTNEGDSNDGGPYGAVYVYKRTGSTWALESYLKPPVNDTSDQFGKCVDVDGDTIVAGSYGEDSTSATIVNGTGIASDNDATGSNGAVHVFVRSGATWSYQAYLKAPNNDANRINSEFGKSVAIDGDTIVVGAHQEKSTTTAIINGTNLSSTNYSGTDIGGVYVFARSGTTWSHQAYLKAPADGNGSNGDNSDLFGTSVAISGNVLAVGSIGEDSSTTTIVNGNDLSSTLDGGLNQGAIYMYRRSGTSWYLEGYLKAPNSDSDDQFGFDVDISGDLAITGVPLEDSNITTVVNAPDSVSTDNSSSGAGAAYIFEFD